MVSQPRHLIETIDTRKLPHLKWWTILPLMYPDYVEDLEVEHHLRALLATGKVQLVHVEPHLGPDGKPEAHLLDVYRVDSDAEPAETAGSTRS
jgi:hypothetical protein